MNQRGYIGLVLLVLGAALGVWLLMYVSPLRTAPGSDAPAGQNVINRANAVQGMADQRDHEIESVMQQ